MSRLYRTPLDNTADDLRRVGETPTQRAFCTLLYKLAPGVAAMFAAREDGAYTDDELDAILAPLLAPGALAEQVTTDLRKAIAEARAVLEGVK